MSRILRYSLVCLKGVAIKNMRSLTLRMTHKVFVQHEISRRSDGWCKSMHRTFVHTHPPFSVILSVREREVALAVHVCPCKRIAKNLLTTTHG